METKKKLTFSGPIGPFFALICTLFLLGACVLSGMVDTTAALEPMKHIKDDKGYYIPNLGECFLSPDDTSIWFCNAITATNPEEDHKIIKFIYDKPGVVFGEAFMFAVFTATSTPDQFSFGGVLNSATTDESFKAGIKEFCEKGNYKFEDVWRAHTGAYLYIPGGVVGKFEVIKKGPAIAPPEVNNINGGGKDRFKGLNNVKKGGFNGTDYISRGIGRGDPHPG